MAFIDGTVGEDGHNARPDVLTIQSALFHHPDHPTPDLRVDGWCGPATVAAIRHLQSRLELEADGLVTPGGPTASGLWPPRFANPTARTLRTRDTHGWGFFASPRDAGPHDGADYRAVPGQMVLAALAGRVTGTFAVYPGGPDAGLLQGVMIEAADGSRCGLYHLRPLPGIQGRLVRAGDCVGHALTLQNRFPGITDHVTVRIRSPAGRPVDPATLIR